LNPYYDKKLQEGGVIKKSKIERPCYHLRGTNLIRFLGRLSLGVVSVTRGNHPIYFLEESTFLNGSHLFKLTKGVS